MLRRFHRRCSLSCPSKTRACILMYVCNQMNTGTCISYVHVLQAVCWVVAIVRYLHLNKPIQAQTASDDMESAPRNRAT